MKPNSVESALPTGAPATDGSAGEIESETAPKSGDGAFLVKFAITVAAVLFAFWILNRMVG